jgi:hypothetical protein
MTIVLPPPHNAKPQNVSGNGRTTHTDKQTPDQTTRPRHKKKIKKAPHRKKFLSRHTASTFAFPTRKPTLQKAKDLAFPTAPKPTHHPKTLDFTALFQVNF